MSLSVAVAINLSDDDDDDHDDNNKPINVFNKKLKFPIDAYANQYAVCFYFVYFVDNNAFKKEKKKKI